jgi:hypothetical protein
MVNTSLRKVAWIAAIASLSLICPLAADAAFTISFPDIVVDKNVTSSFVAPINISSAPSASVTSVNVAVGLSLASGSGSLSMLSHTPGAGIAPPGTIWNTRTINSSVSPPGLPSTSAAKFNIDSINGAVVANGAVLNITFDVSGATPGSVFDVGVNFNNLTTISDASGNPVPTNMITFDGGTVTVVPEPSPFLLIGLCGGLGVLGNWARRRWFAKK